MKFLKRFHGLLVVLIVLAIEIVVALSYNSDQLALRSAHFAPRGGCIISAGIDNTGKEYRVFVENLSDKPARIAYLRKGFAGFWEITELADKPTAGTIRIGWAKTASFKRYAVDDTSAIEWEVHNVYCGTNATRQIVIPEGALPHNVTVNISQAGSAYMLHFIGYGEADVLSQVKVIDLLSAAGCAF